MWRDPAYVLDMLLAARKVLAFTQCMDGERFRADAVMQNAVMHLLTIIGEAARRVSDEYARQHPEVPWRGVVGLRNRLVHEYGEASPDQVWEVVVIDLPALVALIEPLVPPDSPGQG